MPTDILPNKSEWEFRDRWPTEPARAAAQRETASRVALATELARRRALRDNSAT